MLTFDFPEKGLGLVSKPYFLYDFPRKMFLMLHYLSYQGVLLHDQKVKTNS